MPRKAKRPCTYPGCIALVDGGSRCPDHQSEWQRNRNKQIDENRPTAHQRGYDARWRRIRLRVLREAPLCVDCAARGITTAATDVDHIVPLAHGGTHARSNLQSLCKPCHSRKTVQQSLGWSPTPEGRGDQISGGLAPETGPRNLSRATAK